MTRGDIEQGRLDVIEKWGPWIGFNIDLGGGVYTIGPRLVGSAERRVTRIAQAVSDLLGGSLDGVRILDLGSHEGAFGIEMALRGAEVVCVEGRESHVAKAAFAKGCLGLDRLEIVRSDVRQIDPVRLGRFEIVLCLGVLYHLPATALAPLLEALASMCTGFCIVETQISLRPLRSFGVDGRSYSGRTYGEDPAQPGAAMDGEDSFWLTRPSLLNLLADVGFTSVAELLNPTVLDVAEFEDHVTFIAFRGEPVRSLSLPVVVQLDPEVWPEDLPRRRHPTQARWAHVPLLSRLGRRSLRRVLRSKDLVDG